MRLLKLAILVAVLGRPEHGPVPSLPTSMRPNASVAASAESPAEAVRFLARVPRAAAPSHPPRPARSRPVPPLRSDGWYCSGIQARLAPDARRAAARKYARAAELDSAIAAVAEGCPGCATLTRLLLADDRGRLPPARAVAARSAAGWAHHRRRRQTRTLAPRPLERQIAEREPVRDRSVDRVIGQRLAADGNRLEIAFGWRPAGHLRGAARGSGTPPRHARRARSGSRVSMPRIASKSKPSKTISPSSSCWRLVGVSAFIGKARNAFSST